MVTERNTSGQRDAPLRGGRALKQAIHVARAKTDITSDTQLALRARVHYDTLMNWYSERTTPRPEAVRRVAAVLGVPFGDLLAAYEGRDPEPAPLQDAIRDLIAELRTQHDDMTELIRAIRASIGTREAVGNGR